MSETLLFPPPTEQLEVIRDTLANLTANNPIPEDGQLVIASNSSPRIFAFGNGTIPWNTLPKYEERVEPVVATTSAFQSALTVATARTGLAITFAVASVPWVVEYTEVYCYAAALGTTVLAQITDENGVMKATAPGATSAGANYLQGTIIARERITAPGTYQRRAQVSKVGAAAVSVGVNGDTGVYVATLKAAPER